ncbi:MAG TPA: hypothetical protein VG347_04845 [Verrucomicrobiae bacterium]|nr:hypothetical protein [Verrucomicrobiae bacterium]
MISPPRQKKKKAVAILVLTTALVQAANDLVTIYDRVDWDQVQKHDFKTIYIVFPFERAALDAKQMFLEMAAGEPVVRNNLIDDIKSIFHRRGLPLHPDTIGKTNTRRRTVEDLLDTLAKAGSPGNFARQCMQARLLFNRASLKAWQEHQRRQQTGIKPTPRPMGPHSPASKASWLWPVTGRELTLPTRFAFAEPVVGLCRRIAQINTGKDELSLEAAELRPLLLQRRLWAECGPESYQFSSDDHPYGHELQKILNQFVPALEEFLVICDKSIQKEKVETLAVVPLLPTTTLPETQPKIEPPLASPVEKPTSVNQTESLNEVDSSGMQNAEKPETELVTIKIRSPENVLIVEGEIERRIRNDGPKNALRALAALAGPGMKSLEIDSAQFVRYSYRNDQRIPQCWQNDRDQLGKEKIHVELLGNKSYQISGFQIVFEPPVDPEAFKALVLKLEPRVRKPKVKS